MLLNWVEINRKNLEHNVRLFRKIAGSRRKLMAVVKSNAYGHGMEDVARIVVESGVDWLGVYSLQEGMDLRESGFSCPVLVMGYVPLSDLEQAVENDLSLGVSSLETLEALGNLSEKSTRTPRVHLKLETGLNRLGMSARELASAEEILLRHKKITLEGLYTHFANIEDTLQHDFAMLQLFNFEKLARRLAKAGFTNVCRHTACTAAAILFPDTHFDMLRVGIGIYGMWPSKETLITSLSTMEKLLDLRPVITWKSRVAQIKKVKPGDTIGYGRSHRVTRPGKIAIIPTGYADGYDRRLSNRGHVLIHGEKAPVLGRICMNMFMVDVTHIPHTRPEDEVVLLGRQLDASIAAEQLAELIGTINYEVTTRIGPSLPRVVVSEESTKSVFNDIALTYRKSCGMGVNPGDAELICEHK